MVCVCVPFFVPLSLLHFFFLEDPQKHRPRSQASLLSVLRLVPRLHCLSLTRCVGWVPIDLHWLYTRERRGGHLNHSAFSHTRRKPPLLLASARGEKIRLFSLFVQYKHRHTFLSSVLYCTISHIHIRTPSRYLPTCTYLASLPIHTIPPASTNPRTAPYPPRPSLLPSPPIYPLLNFPSAPKPPTPFPSTICRACSVHRPVNSGINFNRQIQQPYSSSRPTRTLPAHR